jgi:oxygen-independent coproporphyrinogen-3 oxidase
MKELIERYNVPVPRYTSYPTVPNWKTDAFSAEAYITRLTNGFSEANKEGISLYIHLPYCESLCTYCGCNTRITVNHKVEGPYVEAVLEEWRLMRKHFTERPKIREIHLGGGTPTFFSPENLKVLVEALLIDAEVTNDASFSFEAHPANTTFEHLETLRKLGFDRLSLGVQDFDPKVQKAINRHQTVADVQRVVDEARGLGYRSINFDLVYGLPFQTLEAVTHAVKEVIKLRPDRIAFYSYAHVPWMHPGQRAYKESDLPGPEAKLQLFTTGREMLIEAGYKAIGFDHFALENDSLYQAYIGHEMHRNFMGFTELHTPYQIGLGVSSISDIGNGFAQNVKTVEGYIEKVKSGVLPFFKGHLLDDEELFIRKHILNITCKLATSWADGSEEEKQYMNAQLPKLETALADELVIVEREGIRVTALGNTLVRHICAAFDRDFEMAASGSRYAQGV